MKIHVAQEDIDNGRGGIPDRCPIARRLKNHVAYVNVYPDIIELYYYSEDTSSSQVIEVKTSEEVKQFTERFDAGLPVEPFSFNLSAECFMPHIESN